jgi:hypothetical protein
MTRLPRLLKLLAAAALAGALLAPGSPAGAAEPPGGGRTFVAPPSIDATGATDVSDALNAWIAHGTADGAPGAPNRIVLRGTYRVEYGLSVGSSGNDRAHPGLPEYSRNHVVLDLTGAVLRQTDPTPFSAAPGLEAVIEPRKRFGVSLLTLVGGSGVTVRGGTLLGSNRFGRYSAFREAWHGVEVNGSEHLRLEQLRIEDVWGDFVYLNHRGRTPARDVVIAGGYYAGNGRQGITMNSVDGLEIAGVEFRDVQRMLFDHEPGRNGSLANVDIHDCRGSSGRLGLVNFHPAPQSPLHDVTIRDHHLDQGHLRVNVDASGAQRQNLSIVGNTSSAGGPYDRNAPLMQIGGPHAGFDGVTVQHNRDVGAGTSPALAISPASTNVVATPNDFPGFQ